MSWAALFTGLAGPVVKKALTALGMGVVTFVAFTTVKGQIDGYVANNLASLPSTTYQLLALGGFIDAIGIWLGAFTAAAAFAAVGRITMLST